MLAHQRRIALLLLVLGLGLLPPPAAAQHADDPLDQLECWGYGIRVGFGHALDVVASTGAGSGLVADNDGIYRTVGHFVFRGTDDSGVTTVFLYIMTGYTNEAVRCDDSGAIPCSIHVTKDSLDSPLETKCDKPAL